MPTCDTYKVQLKFEKIPGNQFQPGWNISLRGGHPAMSIQDDHI